MVVKTIKAAVFFGSLIALSIGTGSCYYDKEELLYPDTLACDAMMVSYMEELEPIFSANCYGCHSNAQSQTAGAGISLEGHANVSGYVSNTAERLIGAISHESGFSPMPKGGARLSDCDISKIQAWINAGAENN